MNFEKLKKDFEDELRAKLPADLFYHNVEHSLNVLAAVERIACSENISGEDMILLKTAALLHDCGFLKRYNKNESEGCSISKKILPKYDYTNDQIQIICNMIMATAIPQNPQNKLEKILCDADLDYLGGDNFFEIAENLRKELEYHGHVYPDKDWLNFELNFLKQHSFFTKTQQKERNNQKQIIINKLQNLLKHIDDAESKI